MTAHHVTSRGHEGRRPKPSSEGTRKRLGVGGCRECYGELIAAVRLVLGIAKEM
jgi:hypothetical protein